MKYRSQHKMEAVKIREIDAGFCKLDERVF